MTVMPAPAPGPQPLLTPVEAVALRAKGERPPKCPHGLDHVARDDGRPRCPCCRRGIPADAPEPPSRTVPLPIRPAAASVAATHPTPGKAPRRRVPAGEPEGQLARVLEFRPRRRKGA